MTRCCAQYPIAVGAKLGMCCSTSPGSSCSRTIRYSRGTPLDELDDDDDEVHRSKPSVSKCSNACTVGFASECLSNQQQLQPAPRYLERHSLGDGKSTTVVTLGKGSILFVHHLKVVADKQNEEHSKWLVRTTAAACASVQVMVLRSTVVCTLQVAESDNQHEFAAWQICCFSCFRDSGTVCQTHSAARVPRSNFRSGFSVSMAAARSKAANGTNGGVGSICVTASNAQRSMRPGLRPS